VTVEREVRDRQGNAFSLRIRPYKNVENRIDGAVLALFDIDVARSTERQAEFGERIAAALMDGLQEPTLLIDSELRIKRLNSAFERRYGGDGTSAWLGQPLSRLDGHRWNLPELAKLLRDAFGAQMPIEDLVLPAPRGHDGARPVLINAKLLPGPAGRPIAMLLRMEEEGGQTGSS
jgi:two-component system CheB/CheR fusion protein